jgi:hypothetical protein
VGKNQYRPKKMATMDENQWPLLVESPEEKNLISHIPNFGISKKI